MRPFPVSLGQIKEAITWVIAVPWATSVAGAPFPLARGVAANTGYFTIMSTSDTGTVAYRTGAGERARQMAWFVHYWDEIHSRNIRSSESVRERMRCGKRVA